MDRVIHEIKRSLSSLALSIMFLWNESHYNTAMDRRGQVSAELLIVIAIMAALALLLAQQLTGSAKDLNKTYSSKISDINKLVNSI